MGGFCHDKGSLPASQKVSGWSTIVDTTQFNFEIAPEQAADDESLGIELQLDCISESIFLKDLSVLVSKEAESKTEGSGVTVGRELGSYDGSWLGWAVVGLVGREV
jgi:hypothetical protein